MKVTVVAAAIGIAVGAALSAPATAAAIPTSGSAADVVKALQDQGYSVQFNSPSTMPLSRCTVTGVHGLVVMMMPDGSLMMRMDPGNPGSVYVDLNCPTSN
ncbi:hypothetical protein EV580_3566 [Mycobacterium sp. BK086]|uniref:hypothetical protein n=1 Tax=Mycobacterium sp. BK086 TaxID=2512165 RepID=UPI00105FBEA2|nr:hypothetical protein [Mycobacterium sp. BK086]TDO11844.1 hypothetical protein EV580_3566 [Mycobacterium sp. BK086]